ncbi:hypothetical protein FRB97_008307 [Tulasnella sp. 331]|nr:hypothetical protein FRB97_008307 [Tulasnella sp. 331]
MMLERGRIMADWDPRNFYLLHLPIEYGHVSEAIPNSKVVLDLVAAQNQLKILGLAKEVIYEISLTWGVARLEYGVVKGFDLDKPFDGLMFRQFLTSLKTDIVRQAKNLDNLMAMELQNLALRPTERWKSTSEATFWCTEKGEGFSDMDHFNIEEKTRPWLE